MIHFKCPSCARAFNVRDQDAGRKARCRTCGSTVVVPQITSETVTDDVEAARETSAEPGKGVQPARDARSGSGDSRTIAAEPAAAVATVLAAPATVAAEPRRIPMRIRRLTADAEQMQTAFAKSPHIRVISTEGSPPELYRLAYTVRSLDRGKKPNQPIPRDTHEVEIQLTSEYPRVSPKCRMLTSIFHPNIDPSTICVGDHWAAGERLVDLAIRIGEMIAYQAYNIKSPLDAEAAMWADLNQDKLPIDTSDLHPAE